MGDAVSSLLFACCLLLASSAALACGHCVEDQVAAVYDHALIRQALDRKHKVVFFAIEGALEANSAQRRDIERAAAKVAGVDARSVRLSIESAALSAAFDPARVSAEQIRQSVQERLILKGLSLKLLRVMEQPAMAKSAAQP